MFSFYPMIEYELAATQLVLAMSGVGATLELEQFREIIRRPHPVAIILTIQYLVLPALAALCGRALGLEPGIAVGLVLINSVPGGTLASVFTYLGLGNLTLSIVMTCASTVVCFLGTPLALRWFTSGALPDDFSMPIGKTLFPIVFFLLLPVSFGALIAYLFPERKKQFTKWVVRISLVPLSMIVVGALSSGRIDVTDYGLQIPTILVAFITVTFISANTFSRLIGYSSSDAFTMALEVSMHNGNLALALIATFFPAAKEDPIGTGVFFVALFYSGATMVVTGLAVIIRRVRLAIKAQAAKVKGDSIPATSEPVE